MAGGGRAPAAVALALVAGALVAAPAQPWGNGTSSSAEFRYYGVHDAIADLAYADLSAAEPAAARFIGHWYLPRPGDYAGSYRPQNLVPTATDNFLGYTDDPDSAFQDWCNHLYLVHPRPGHTERCAPARVAELMEGLGTNLTLWCATGMLPCTPFDHAAAYHAGLMAHYVGDLSQWGHTDHTAWDHSHPRDDPQRRTYHGYYESATWGNQALRALLDAQAARRRAPEPVADVEDAVVALAERVNRADGATVTVRDVDGASVQVGATYRDMLTGFAAAYDAGQAHQGQRGYTPALWAATMDHVEAAVKLLAGLYLTAWQDAVAAVPLTPPVQVPSPHPGCPDDGPGPLALPPEAVLGERRERRGHDPDRERDEGPAGGLHTHHGFPD